MSKVGLFISFGMALSKPVNRDSKVPLNNFLSDTDSTKKILLLLKAHGLY